MVREERTGVPPPAKTWLIATFAARASGATGSAPTAKAAREFICGSWTAPIGR
jgi:hypothetical protein